MNWNVQFCVETKLKLNPNSIYLNSPSTICGKLTNLYETSLDSNSLIKIPCKSRILTDKQWNELLDLCNLNKHTFKCIYSASIDGFEAKSFHSKCDNIRNTLTDCY